VQRSVEIGDSADHIGQGRCCRPARAHASGCGKGKAEQREVDGQQFQQGMANDADEDGRECPRHGLAADPVEREPEHRYRRFGGHARVLRETGREVFEGAPDQHDPADRRHDKPDRPARPFDHGDQARQTHPDVAWRQEMETGFDFPQSAEILAEAAHGGCAGEQRKRAASEAFGLP
jgi:hypothetical protein